MGAWGYSIYENDDAMDFMSDHKYLMEKKGYSYREAIDQLMLEYTNNDRLMIVGDMEFNKFGEILHIEEIKQALIDELNNIDSWRDKFEREKVLRKLANKWKIEI